MKLTELRQEMNHRFEEINDRLKERDDRWEATICRLDARITEEGEITRCHFDVVAESMRAEIRELARVCAAPA